MSAARDSTGKAIESTVRRRAGDGGFAMLMVLVFIAISLMAVTAGYEKVRQVTLAEAAGGRIAAGSEGTDRALGIGIARLQTGVPAQDPFTCRVRLLTSDGDQPLHFDLIHTAVAADRWTVEARPADDSQPECPSVYSDACPLVLP